MTYIIIALQSINSPKKAVLYFNIEVNFPTNWNNVQSKNIQCSIRYKHRENIKFAMWKHKIHSV